MSAIKKKEFNFDALRKTYSSVAKLKEDRFFDIGKDFYDATGLPGPAMGHVNMFIGHSDTGKGQPLSSKILTPTGWKKMGDIKVGDSVIGSDGNSQKILGVFPQGKKNVYKVTLSDGGITYCDDEHLWLVNEYKQRHKGKRDKDGIKRYVPDNTFRVHKLTKMLSKVKYSKQKYNNYLLPTLMPITFVDESNLPINPYVLGCYLGDGYFALNKKGRIKSASIYSIDSQIILNISNTIHYKSSKVQERENRLPITKINLTSSTKKNLINLGVNVTSEDKFIPNDYIFKATIKDRLSLLHGLMDTDGYCDQYGTAEFTTVSHKLKDSIIELVRSLGGVTRVREKIPFYNYKGNKLQGKLAYTITIRLPEPFNPFSLYRKAGCVNKNRKLIKRYISDISYSHKEECQCIKVSNDDQLYVTDDFILTHNTTALIKTAVDAQKKGVLPIFLITEQKWSFEHAKTLGLDINKDKDEWNGFFIYKVGFKYIEQIFDYIKSVLDAQEKDEIPYDLVFLWDSVGSIPCQMSFDGKGGTQHTARVISEKFGMGLAHRFTASRSVESKYTNTIVIANQPWVEVDMQNPMNQPKIRSKGGNAIYLASTLVFLFGLQKNSGISRLTAQRNKRKINFATRTKVGIIKNHVNGLGYSDGRIIATPHGFIRDSSDSLTSYKKEYAEYWDKIFLANGVTEGGEDMEIFEESFEMAEDE